MPPNQPLDFYAESCSAGYDALHLEVLAIDGKTLPQPIIVERGMRAWSANFIHTVTLEPGAMMVREVHFAPSQSFMGGRYHNFPVLTPRRVHSMRLRAVFTVQAEQDPFPLPRSPSHLWVGSTASETHEYQVQQY